MLEQQQIQDQLWTSDYLKILMTNFTASFAFYLVTPLLPIFLSSTFSAPKDTIGLALSGYAVTAILSRPVAGWMVDTLPRQRVLLACIFFNVLFFGSYIFAGSLTFFVIMRTIHGSPFGAFTVANNTAVIDVLKPDRRNEGIGFYGLSNNIAMAVAPTVGIYTYTALQDFDVLFLMALLIAAVGFAIACTVRMRPHAPPPQQRKICLGNFVLLKGWLIGGNMIFFGCCYGALSNYLAIYGKESLGITGGTGIYFLLLAMGLVLSRLVGNRHLRQGKFIRHALWGILASTCGYTIFVVSSGSLGYYGSALLIGLGNGHLWPAFQNMMLGVAQNYEHGTAMSTILSSWSLGIGCGIFGGGFLVEYCGYAFMFQTVAILHAVGLLLFVTATRPFFHRQSRAHP
ncbi:MAG: MFS transporter [Desulfovibrionaceae bacterium]|nr:MFS transporter [Desulfovibrionaceae bacterium]